MSAAATRRTTDVAAEPWDGPTRRYDIVKEFAVALGVMSLLALGLRRLFSSPDEPALTFQGWGETAPENFYAVAVQELAGTSEAAGYGPPYNARRRAQRGTAAAPEVERCPDRGGPGERLRGHAAADRHHAGGGGRPPAVGLGHPRPAVHVGDRLDTASRRPPTPAGAAPGAGPSGRLRAGAGDGARAARHGAVRCARRGDVGAGQFYQSDHTKQILFLGDGSYLDDAATSLNLQGNTWGMMNGIHDYPGQPWLWWASVWYQIPIFNPAEDATSTTSLQDNADEWVFLIVGLLGLCIIFYPVIPGLNRIPNWVPVHRLIWRDYYKKHGNSHLT